MTGRGLFGIVTAALVAICVAVRMLTAVATVAPASAQPAHRGATDYRVTPSADQPDAGNSEPDASDTKRFVGVAAVPVAVVPGGSTIATLYVSAPVAIEGGAEKGMTHVSTRLWTHGDPVDTGLLYTAPGEVEVGRLDAAPAAHTVSDAARTGWTLINIDGYVPTKAIVSSLSSVWLGAEFSYHLACAECHVRHAPREYPAMQWGMIVPRMAKFAKLDETIPVYPQMVADHRERSRQVTKRSGSAVGNVVPNRRRVGCSQAERPSIHQEAAGLGEALHASRRGCGSIGAGDPFIAGFVPFKRNAEHSRHIPRCPATIILSGVLPHPGMLPSRLGAGRRILIVALYRSLQRT